MAKTHKFRFILTATALLFALLFWVYHAWNLDRSFQRIEKDNRGIPVIIAYLDTIPISGMGEARLKLTLTNDFSTPRWYVFPPIFGDTLPLNGFFQSALDTPYIESRKYPEEKSNLQIVETRFLGTDAPMRNSLLAFYMPPKSTIVLEDYYVLMLESALSQGIEVWEVETLLVDGSTPFEQWRPFDLLCSSNVHLKLKTIGTVSMFRHLDSDFTEQHGSNSSSSGKVSNIQAKGIKKLSVKVK